MFYALISPLSSLVVLLNNYFTSQIRYVSTSLNSFSNLVTFFRNDINAEKKNHMVNIDIICL